MTTDAPAERLTLPLPAPHPTITAVANTDTTTGVTRYQFTVDGFRVQITYYPPTSPQARGRRATYQIRIDGEQVHFATRDNRQIESQIAHVVGTAINDKLRAARRASLLSGRRWDWWRP